MLQELSSCHLKKETFESEIATIESHITSSGEKLDPVDHELKGLINSYKQIEGDRKISENQCNKKVILQLNNNQFNEFIEDLRVAKSSGRLEEDSAYCREVMPTLARCLSLTVSVRSKLENLKQKLADIEEKMRILHSQIQQNIASQHRHQAKIEEYNGQVGNYQVCWSIAGVCQTSVVSNF